MQQALAFFSSLQHLPFQWFILIGFTFVVAADALRSGTNRGAAFLLAAPLAQFLYLEVPHAIFLDSITKHIPSQYGGAVFGILFIAAFFICYRAVASFDGASSGAAVSAVLVAVSCVIVLIVVWLQIPELHTLFGFGPLIERIFGETYRLWWLIVSYVLLAFVRT
jgi:hypothetical protein